MGRPPCCDKANVKRGLWTAEEDMKILAYISTHGVGNWTSVPKKAGLKRCGKSCRLRWTNYLRPDLKHDGFTQEEEELIIQLHATIGSRWSMIAGQLPGRTDNDVKNLWNTKLRKKLFEMGIDPVTHKPISQVVADYGSINLPSTSHHHHHADPLATSANRDLIKKAFQIKSESIPANFQYQDYHDSIGSINNYPMPSTSLDLNLSSHNTWEVLGQIQALQQQHQQQQASSVSSSFLCSNEQAVAPSSFEWCEPYRPEMEACSSSSPPPPPPAAPPSFNWCQFLSDDAFIHPKQEDGSMFYNQTNKTQTSSKEAAYNQNYQCGQYGSGLMQIGRGLACEETSSANVSGDQGSSRSFVDQLLEGEKYEMVWDCPDILLQDP